MNLRAFLILAIAALSAAPLPGAFSKPLVTYSDTEEPDKKAPDKEVAVVQAQLDELQGKIARKEIPPIEFELGSTALKASAKPALELVARLLIRHPHLKLMIFGHTDNVGGRKYNLDLSRRRAEAVKDCLVELGVTPESLRAKGFGMDKPLLPNDSDENRAKNRRVEFLVTNRSWDSVY